MLPLSVVDGEMMMMMMMMMMMRMMMMIMLTTPRARPLTGHVS
jgi:hypothetical protein